MRTPALLGAALLAGGLLASACKKDAPSEPGPPIEDHTVQKLREELEREKTAKGEGDRLADLAVGAHPAGDADAALPVPANAKAKVGPFDVAVTSLHAKHRVSGGGKVSLTSEDWFVRVELEAANAEGGRQNLDLAFARLRAEGQDPLPIARDAQRVEGTRELAFELGSKEKKSAVLYFEVPQAALGKGMKLELPAAVAGNQDVLIPLDAK